MIEPLLCGIVLGLVPITLLGLFVSACSPAVAQEPIILDHYKTIIDQKPYHVEVCSDVSTSEIRLVIC